MKPAYPFTQPCRRWLRYGIRTFLVAMVLVAIPLAWKVNRVHTQRQAVEKIVQAGGMVMYDYEAEAAESAPNLSGPRTGEPPGPKWIRAIVGDDFFATAVRVYLAKDGARVDETLAAVGALTQINVLAASGVTDAELARVAGFTSLTNLSLEGDFTDQGLEALARLDRLALLDLSSPKMTGDSLSRVRSFDKLRYLGIAGDQLTDQSVDALVTRLPAITELTIRSDGITDATLERLKGCTNLQTLVVNGEGLSTKRLSELQTEMPDCDVRIPIRP